MFEVRLAHDRDVARAEQWLREADGRTLRGLGAYAAAADEQRSAVEMLRRDRETAARGSFVHVSMAIPERYAAAVGKLDPRAAEGRLLDVAERTIRGLHPHAQGVVTVGQRARTGEPTITAVLSPRLTDGRVAPVLLRNDAVALEARWEATLRTSLGYARTDRPSVEEQRQRADVVSAASRVDEQFRGRLRGETTPAELRAAEIQAQVAASRWREAAARAQAGTETPRFDVLRMNVEGGRAYFGRLRPADADLAIQRAVRTLAPAGSDVRIIKYHAGDDLRLSVASRGVDQERLRSALVAGLRDELERQAAHHGGPQRGEVGELGRVEAIDPSPARTQAAAAIREEAMRERESNKRHEVLLRHARGGELLQPMSWDDRLAAVGRALERTFPFLAQQDRKPEFRTAVNGRVLDVSASLPTVGGLSREQLERPIFQLRFGRELYREVVARLGVREVAIRPPAAAGNALTRGLSQVMKHLAGDRLRNAAADPGGAVARVGFDALSRALPGPLRAVQSVGRFIGRVAQQDE